jgi:hypothetical protein
MGAQFGHWKSVHEQEVGNERKPLDRSAHGQQTVVKTLIAFGLSDERRGTSISIRRVDASS